MLSLKARQKWKRDRPASEARPARETSASLSRLNKQIAFDLRIGEIAVKLHRGNVMRKMRLTSVGELIRVWEVLPAEVRENVEL